MALSIKTKIWLPAIAVSIGLVLMSTGSAVRTGSGDWDVDFDRAAPAIARVASILGVAP